MEEEKKEVEEIKPRPFVFKAISKQISDNSALVKTKPKRKKRVD
jgi:hypothetical protein